MKKLSMINMLMVGALLVALVSVSGVSAQSGIILTATGQVCATSDTGPLCFNFTFDFDPAGGPVSGAYWGTVPWTDQGVSYSGTADGTLTGVFDGGNGGLVQGTMMGVSTTTSGGQSYSEDVSGDWAGYLYSNGTGQGAADALGEATWEVTFDSQAFQSALEEPIPTLDSFPTDTPTSEYVDILVGPPTILVHSWPELDTAIAEILNQDDAIVARDEQGVYYVIDNQGNQRILPAEMQPVMQMNNEFGLLQNANLLWASPAVQAFAAANGSEALDAIIGAGTYQFYSIPEWLKQRQYLKVSNQCQGGYCSSYTTVSVLASSLHFNPYALASSEHSSVRGTINGGGDFIYEPFWGNGMKLASPAYEAPGVLQNSVTRPYLGVQVLDVTDRAYIQMVQRGSPADDVGLAVDDQIVSVDGAYLDDSQNTLAALISQYSGGDQVELGVIRLGDSTVTPITVTLAILLPPVVVTPAAEITINDQTDFMVDIGLNGVTAVLVLADWAHVREPETGSEVDVPAGSMVIVVSGYEIGDPIQVSSSEIYAWWNGGQQPTPFFPDPTPSPSPTPTPVPDVNWLLAGMACCLCAVVIVAIVVVIILVARKKRQPVVPPPSYSSRR